MAQFIKYTKTNLTKQLLKYLGFKDGGLMYPTVYMVGCDITNSKALERIAKIKE
jgi:tRNA A37 threonylcarbamoyladenosine synthetase subunit TsaC/SUA5/YrdC